MVWKKQAMKIPGKHGFIGETVKIRTQGCSSPEIDNGNLREGSLYCHRGRILENMAGPQEHGNIP